jgi:DNA-binding transcriptional ArsR family regulator
MPKRRRAAFAALGDPTREQIVRLLLQGEKSVGEIAGRLPVSRPAVSKHLRMLEGAGLVTFRSLATRHVYSVDPDALQSLRDELNRMWEQALSRYALMANNRAPGASSRVRR